MIEIFNTDIKNSKEANIISGLIHLCFPHLNIHVDLYDVDHVLRVEDNSGEIDTYALKKYVKSIGFNLELVN